LLLILALSLTMCVSQLKALDANADSGTPVANEGPRQFKLHKYVPLRQSLSHCRSVFCLLLTVSRNFYQMRLDRRANMERAKREQARVKDPTFFPAAPKGDIA